MDNEILQNIWQNLSANNLTDTEFEEWTETFMNDTEVQENVHEYLFDNDLTESSFEEWSTNIGLKKNDQLDSELPLADGGLESKDKGVDTLTPSPQPFLRNRKPGYYPEGEKNTAIERMFGKNEVTDFFGDLYRSGVQGYRQGATVDDAINLFAQGQDVSDEDLNEYIQEYRNLKSVAPSEEMQDFSDIYEKEGKGVYGFIKGVLNNPTVVPQLFTSSVVAMVNKGSIAGGLAGAGTGAAVGALPGALIGGIAGVSGALETGLAYSEFLEEELNKKGLAFDEKGIRQVLQDDEAMVRIRNRSLGRGISIAAIDAVTGGLAAGVTRRAALKTSKALAGAAGIGVESLGGATGEAVARGVAGQEMDIAEIGFEGIAGTATAPLTVGAGLLKPGSYQLNGGKATRKQVQDLVNKGTPDEIAGAQITIKNDPELFKAAETKKADAILIAQIKEANPGINEEDQAALLGLEKKRQTLENSSLKSAKNNLAIVDEQIDKISQKYQGTEETIVTTEEEVRESLAAKGIENPTQEQLIEESDILTNKKIKDADTIESPAEVLNEEQSEVGEAVVEGDNQSTEPAGEVTQTQEETTSQPAQESQVETEVSETETIITKPIDEKYDVRIKNNKVFNIVDKQGNQVDPKLTRRLEKKIIDQKLITLAQNDLDVSQVNPEARAQTIIEESKSPRQIAETINSLQEVKQQDLVNIDEATVVGLGSLFGKKFSSESIQKITGFKNLQKEFGRGFVRTWIDKDKNQNNNIEDGVYDENENLIEPNEIIEFITQYPTRQDYLQQFDNASQLLADAKIKFTELTGLKATPANIKQVIASPSIQEIETDVFLEQQQEEGKMSTAEMEAKIKKEVERRTGQEKPIDTEETKRFKAEIKKAVDRAVTRLTKPFNTITDRLITLNFERLGSSIKSSIKTGRGKITEGIRSTPTPKVDQVLGLNNSTVVYNTIFEPVYKAYAKFAGEFDVINFKVDRAQNLLRTKGKAKNQNDVNRQSLEIGVYLHALESEANKVDGQFSELSPSVKDMLKSTIDYYRIVGNSLDANILQDIENKFEQDGDITAEGILSKLNPGQKQAAKILINQNKSLYNFAKTAADRRGRPFVALENYNHRQALETQKKNVDVLNKEAEQFSQGAGTFAVTLIKREEGARPINFNAFQTVKRGTQETYLDYYLTPDVIKTQDTARALSNKYKKGNKGQRAASQALQSSLNELLQVTYLNTYTESRSSIANKFLVEAKRLAYRALLGSAPRFAAEIIGNASMLAAQSPEVIAEAYGKYKDISMKVGAADNIKFLNMLKNLNSGEIRKLGGERGNALFDLQADTKYSDDNNILNLSESELGMKGPVAQKMEYLASLGPKQIYSGISKVSDFLMGGADRVIARPIWVSKFANEFKKNVKKYNKEDIDFTVDDFKALQVEKSNSKYLDPKYKRALDEAVSDADRTSVDIVTSGNPLGAIIKNIRRPESGLMNWYRVANSFMANFTLNEYATARFAVGALFKEGKISQREAAMTLAGVLARMSSYVILYKSFANYLDQLFGAPEDEDEDMSNLLKRQIVGSMSTLMFRQNLGNIPALPINLGIEYINENYLEELRDGKPYNAYDNSLVYSLVNLDQLGKKSLPEILAPVAFGPAGPALRDFSRITTLAARTQTRKTEEARQRAYDELMNVYTFDVFGQLGLIPFYKDVRRINRKKFFDQEKKDSKIISKSELKKLNPKLYKKLYGPNSPEGRRKKKEDEIRRKRKPRK
tara:strand:- start:5335 stop:10563 length:5229 start_codon:yes stop_codon:yes gene_type:complete